jgi:VCBS repeat protein
LKIKNIGVYGVQAAQNFAAGIGPTCVAGGDFNGDGILDLAVGNGIQGGSGIGSVLLGNGDGTFRPPVSFSGVPGATVFSIAVGDFNNDNIPDLAAATDELAWVALGNGDGTFRTAVNYAAGSFPRSVAAGDFNGDLAVANQSSNNVSVLVGNVDGSFYAADKLLILQRQISAAW